MTDAGLLASTTPKGPVSLRFPAKSLEVLFPAFTRRLILAANTTLAGGKSFMPPGRVTGVWQFHG